MDATVSSVTSPTPADHRRVDWLDGLRGASAMFVVLHHVWLSVWPSFPRNAGPWWVGWMLYGHLAVAVFIIVSGFSLTLAPMRRGGTLAGGTRRFIRRRAWRILPPYWMALIISTIITAGILEPGLGLGVVAKGFVVHGLLVQDAVGSFAPNGAFWSIAVEWQIYFVFPVILWVALRYSVPVAVTAVAVLVIAAHEAALLGSPLSKVDHLTPQFLALFALGVAAAYAGHGERSAERRGPLMVGGMGILAGVVVAAVVEGSVWMVSRYFWVDLVFGAGVACVVAALYGGGGAGARRLLSSRMARRCGLFSYSIYLLHGPLVALLTIEVLRPMHLAPLVMFGLLLILGVPLILAVCYGFHLVFEAPFLQHRSLSSVRTMPILRGIPPRRRGASSSGSSAPVAEAVVAGD